MRTEIMNSRQVNFYFQHNTLVLYWCPKCTAALFFLALTRMHAHTHTIILSALVTQT